MVSLIVETLSAGACDAALRLRHLTVVLPTNLAGRRVVDAFDGRAHEVFNGAQLLTPKALPAGFSIVFELPADVLRTESQHAVSRPRYWERIWSKPASAGSRFICGTSPQRPVAMYQGTGGFPRYEPSQLRSVGTIRVQGQLVPVQRVKQGGDLVAGWKDPTTGQQVLLESQTCGKQKPYTIAAFTKIGQSVR